MRKFFALFLTFISLFACFYGCQKVNPLKNCLSELRSDLFYGESENFAVKAGYGFKEKLLADQTSYEKVYELTFKLANETSDGAIYCVNLDFNGNTYKADFKLNPVTHALTASIEIENFNLKEFTVTLTNASIQESVTLRSTLPDGTIDHVKALEFLQKHQQPLLNNYTNEQGEFTAKIQARVLIKNDKPYWYIGIVNGDNLKALLIDGITGEVLAIREVF